MATIDLNESRQTEVLIVAWVMTGAAIFTVSIKLFARVRTVHVVGWDDALIFFSLISSIIASCFVHYGVHLGFGRHTAIVVAESGMERLFQTARFQMLGYPFNIGAFSLPNISIVILVCQDLGLNAQRTTLLYGMAILQVLFALMTIVLMFAQCQPTRRLWLRALPGTCWHPNVVNYFSYWLCAYITMTDVVLAVVPVFAFRNLPLPRSTKIGLCTMMSWTMLSAIVTIIKGTYLPLFTAPEDPLYNSVPLVLWELVEQNVAIIAACVPTMRPFFQRAWARERSNTKSGSRSQNLFTTVSSSKGWGNNRKTSR